ncbi:hypothetical protein BKA70DRAFT_1115538 [Coprinopsis sp. MPI-PUGE-AT-0042]|nr:hypothetical protein BKA70DRAFT_1115538 [Coprinopsis sp. MPI-PUGE-AT-0042]
MPKQHRKSPKKKGKSASSSNRPLPQPEPIPDIDTVDAAERPATHPLFTDPGDRRVASSQQQSAAAKASNAAGPQPGGTARERAAWTDRFRSELNSNPIPYATWIAARTPDADAQITASAATFFASIPEIAPPVPKSNYVSWMIGNIWAAPSKYDKSLYDAAKARKRQRNIDHDQNRKARAEWHGFKSPEDYERFHLLVFHYWVKRRPAGCEVPSRNTWVLEMPEAFEEAAGYLNTQPLADSRRHNGGRPTPVQMDYSLLTIVIPEDLNIVLHDADSKSSEVFASVVRNFSGSPSMLGWVKGVVSEAVESWRSIRKEDSGQLVQIGWTGGLRSKPIFGSARNLLRRVADIMRVDQRNAVAAAYMWRRVKLMHPQCVGDDIENWHKEHDLPRLDGTWPAAGAQTHGPILYPASCVPISIKDAEFGPGCLVMSENYSRAVHRETQPHEWACSWTTLRTGTNPRGNHFYISNFGVCIRVAEDTSIAWKPTHYHTSSMGSWNLKASFGRHTEDPTMRQQGISFVTSSRIATVYKQYKDRLDLSGKERFEGAQATLLATNTCDDIYE